VELIVYGMGRLNPDLSLIAAEGAQLAAISEDFSTFGEELTKS